VEWLFIKDRDTQLSLFQAGQVDIPFHDARVPAADAASLGRSHPGYPFMYWDALAVRSLAMRTDRPPFNDVRVRRALSLAIDRKKWVAQYPDGQGLEDPGPVPAALREWKLSPRDLGEGARYLAPDPALARKLLAEAGFPAGLRVKCAYSSGDGREHVEEIERLTASLKSIGIELAIVDDESDGRPRGAASARPEETSWGPAPTSAEVDGCLYAAFRSGQPGNRSRVADARLDAMLDGQRRDLSRASRKRTIEDIQRHVAERVYYVYPPAPRLLSSWAPRVRNYAPRNSVDRGAQLEVVWVDAP